MRETTLSSIHRDEADGNRHERSERPAAIRLVELESLVGNLYVAKDVIGNGSTTDQRNRQVKQQQ